MKRHDESAGALGTIHTHWYGFAGTLGLELEHLVYSRPKRA
jgi:hypothetical protein